MGETAPSRALNATPVMAIPRPTLKQDWFKQRLRFYAVSKTQQSGILGYT